MENNVLLLKDTPEFSEYFSYPLLSDMPTQCRSNEWIGEGI